MSMLRCSLAVYPVLGLVGLAAFQGMDCAVGSRREKNAIMVKSGSRNVRGKVQAYLWKQMMPEIGYVIDTQTAYKAFKAPVLKKILKVRANVQQF